MHTYSTRTADKIRLSTAKHCSPDFRRKSVPHADVEVVLIVQLPLGPKPVQVKLLALRHPLHLEAQLLLQRGFIPGVGDGLAWVEQDGGRLLGPHLVVVHGHLREVLESKWRRVEGSIVKGDVVGGSGLGHLAAYKDGASKSVCSVVLHEY